MQSLFQILFKLVLIVYTSCI